MECVVYLEVWRRRRVGKTHEFSLHNHRSLLNLEAWQDQDSFFHDASN